MKPNYKKSAQKYRDMFYDSQERISALLQGHRDMTAHLSMQATEIAELKIKYSEALDKIIELQEKIRGGEG